MSPHIHHFSLSVYRDKNSYVRLGGEMAERKKTIVMKERAWVKDDLGYRVGGEGGGHE